MLHDATEDTPRRAERADDRAADLRAAEPRVVAHRHLDDLGATPRRLDDHLYRPAVRRLAQLEGPQEVLACGTERSRVGERDAAERPDHRGRETVAGHRIAPGLRVPASREPTTRSATPARSGASSRGISAGRSL